MRFHVRPLFAIALLFTLFCSCNGFEHVRKSSDINYKLTKANEYYERKWFHRANELYHDLLPVLKGTKNYEALFYRYAYTFYYNKDWLSAALYFKTFVDYFPNSKDAEECQYMHAVSLFKEAPKASLEQTNTIKAMEAMQTFINQRPESKRIVEANGYIDEGRKKLEQKEADAAKLYYNIAQYHAAAISFKIVINTYPDSYQSDYYQLMIVKSLYHYAKYSIETKQEERYASALMAYNELKETYPKSKYLEEGQKFYTLSENNIKHLRNEQ